MEDGGGTGGDDDDAGGDDDDDVDDDLPGIERNLHNEFYNVVSRPIWVTAADLDSGSVVEVVIGEGLCPG